MRGGKDEDKVINPMFPRLHVNDTERGGPRAPPRNKMALYEQLSIPSQRFGSGSASNGPATSSSTHDGGRERSLFTPFCNSSAPSRSTKKIHSYSSTGANLNDAIASHGSMKLKDCQSSDATMRFQSVAKCQPPNFSNLRNSSHKRNVGDKVVGFPAFSRSGVASHCVSTQHSKEKEQSFPLFRVSSSLQAQSAEKHVSPKAVVDPSSRQNIYRDTTLVDPCPSLSAKDGSSGSLKRAHSSSDPKYRSLLDAMNKRHETDAHVSQESPNLRDKTALLEDSPEGMVRVNCPMVTGEPCLRPSASCNNGPNKVTNGNMCVENKECGSVQAGEAEKDNDVSESSMVDSASVSGISPDDVVGVMGEKHFWKARRAIVNQQRVFAVQVFELHRLIKVQRMIAASPHLLLQDSLSFGKSSLKGSVIKKLSSESVPKHRNGSQKPNPDTEFGGETAFPSLPLPFVNDDASKRILPNYAPYSGNQPVISNPKPSPPWNQWLVPVMSPSEGFVYKPLIAPVYGNYDPTSLTTPRNGDFLNNAGYAQAYFPPYAMPVMNPPPENQLSNVDINLAIPHQSSCNMSSQISQAMSCRAGKESELQGSTASSPSSRVNEAQALPLFPLASDLNVQAPPRASEEPPARVIKVVPHNPRSATESAARIFQFIQEERKQFE